MARPPKAFPSLTCHKPTGRARVTLNGKTFQCGPWGSVEARERYDQLIAEWVAAGRDVRQMSSAVTISGLCFRFRDHAREHYRKPDGTISREVENIKYALKPLWENFGSENVNDFGPRKLSRLRDIIVDSGLARTTVNQRIARIVRVFRWGVAQELVNPEVLQGLQALPGLRRGRTRAPDRPPVMPVDEQTVQRSIPFMHATAASMVMVQYLTGMRPGELVAMTPNQVDWTGEVWMYRPFAHKNSHREKLGEERTRVVAIGPKAQALLGPLTPDDASQPYFRSRSGGGAYTVNGYNLAIKAGIKRANEARGSMEEEIPTWSANQLRHSRLTDVRQRYGLESAQNVAGHATADTTQIYAERDIQAAMRVAKDSG